MESVRTELSSIRDVLTSTVVRNSQDIGALQAELRRRPWFRRFL